MSDYEKMKRFMTLLHRFHTVDRVAVVPTLPRATNAVEHSYQLAMLAWYVASSQKLPLDLSKVLMYSLAHDIVEAYAGDTPTFDTKGRETKEVREKAAQDRIADEFEEFPDIIATLESYERREDNESRFVYALDKLIDPLNSAMTTDRLSVWKEYGIGYDAHHKYKDAKVRTSEHVAPLWEALSEELLLKQDYFFPQESKHTED